MGLTKTLRWFQRVVPQSCLICGIPLCYTDQTLSIDPNPANDIGCAAGVAIQTSIGICKGCLSLQKPIRDGICTTCGVPISTELRVCTRCRERKYAFSHHSSVYLYEGVIRKLISLYKFHDRKELSYLFADVIYSQYRVNYPEMVIVPAPALPGSRKRRGWDQVEVIAKLLNTVYEVPLLDCLSREKGPSQKSLDYEGRIKNLRGKIKMKRLMRTPESVVILDDVFTTGATMHECAKVLRSRGIENVAAMSLALDC